MDLKFNVKRVKLHNSAFTEMRKDANLVADLEARGHAIANAAGSGYEVSSYSGKTRHRVSVITESYDAAKDTAENNTLLKALDAGR